jgi:uncharacterized protein (DUF433 family)
VQCRGCGTTIRSRLGDQAVIAELRAQGWRPPGEPEPDLVDELAERLRPFQLRFGENTASLIAAGRRALHLTPDERRELAEHLAVLVDELLKGRTERPGPGDHVLVTVDPQRNFGRVSIAHCMVPIRAAAGLLYAGEKVEAVREEYGLTAAEVAVVAALAEDFRDITGDEEHAGDVAPPPELDSCRPVDVVVGGQEETVVVHGREPLDEQGRAALAELVVAARRRAETKDPHAGVRQELVGAARLARWCIPDGTVRTRFGEHDGAEVKARLRAAVTAAREALSARRNDGDTDV